MLIEPLNKRDLRLLLYSCDQVETRARNFKLLFPLQRPWITPVIQESILGAD